MNPLIVFTGGLLCTFMGAASLLPFGLSPETSDPQNRLVALLGLTLLLGGIYFTLRHFRAAHFVSLPAPVRMAVTSCLLFLSFCALEFSDGLINQGGRVFYWTSVLFLPALALFFGLVLAQRWAWWLARILAVAFTLWFITFLFLIPFADLRTHGVPVPLLGRIYMTTVTLIFATISFYVFRSLGHTSARTYFNQTR